MIAEARNNGIPVHFASLVDLCHLKHSEPQSSTYNGRVVLQGDLVVISITNDGCKKTWTLFQDYQVAQDMQLTKYPLILRSKIQDAPTLLIP